MILEEIADNLMREAKKEYKIACADSSNKNYSERFAKFNTAWDAAQQAYKAANEAANNK